MLAKFFCRWIRRPIHLSIFQLSQVSVTQFALKSEDDARRHLTLRLLVSIAHVIVRMTDDWLLWGVCRAGIGNERDACVTSSRCYIDFLRSGLVLSLFNGKFDCLLPKSCLQYRQHPFFQVRMPVQFADLDHRAVHLLVQAAEPHQLIRSRCESRCETGQFVTEKTWSFQTGKSVSCLTL